MHVNIKAKAERLSTWNAVRQATGNQNFLDNWMLFFLQIIQKFNSVCLFLFNCLLMSSYWGDVGENGRSTLGSL